MKKKSSVRDSVVLELSPIDVQKIELSFAVLASYINVTPEDASIDSMALSSRIELTQNRQAIIENLRNHPLIKLLVSEEAKNPQQYRELLEQNEQTIYVQILQRFSDSPIVEEIPLLCQLLYNIHAPFSRDVSSYILSFAVISEIIELLIALGMDNKMLIEDRTIAPLVTPAILQNLNHNMDEDSREQALADLLPLKELNWKMFIAILRHDNERINLLISNSKDLEIAEILEALELLIQFGQNQAVEDIINNSILPRITEFESDDYIELVKSAFAAMIRGNPQVSLAFIQPQLWDIYTHNIQIKILQLILLRSGNHTKTNLMENLLGRIDKDLYVEMFVTFQGNKELSRAISDSLKSYQKDILTLFEEMLAQEPENNINGVLEFRKLLLVSEFFDLKIRREFIKKNFLLIKDYITKTNFNKYQGDHRIFYNLLKKVEEELEQEQALLSVDASAQAAVDDQLGVSLSDDRPDDAPESNAAPKAKKKKHKSKKKKTKSSARDEEVELPVEVLDELVAIMLEDDQVIELTKVSEISGSIDLESVVIPDIEEGDELHLESSISLDDHPEDTITSIQSSPPLDSRAVHKIDVARLFLATKKQAQELTISTDEVIEEPSISSSRPLDAATAPDEVAINDHQPIMVPSFSFSFINYYSGITKYTVRWMENKKTHQLIYSLILDTIGYSLQNYFIDPGTGRKLTLSAEDYRNLEPRIFYSTMNQISIMHYDEDSKIVMHQIIVLNENNKMMFQYFIDVKMGELTENARINIDVFSALENALYNSFVSYATGERLSIREDVEAEVVRIHPAIIIDIHCTQDNIIQYYDTIIVNEDQRMLLRCFFAPTIGSLAPINANGQPVIVERVLTSGDNAPAADQASTDSSSAKSSEANVKQHSMGMDELSNNNYSNVMLTNQEPKAFNLTISDTKSALISPENKKVKQYQESIEEINQRDEGKLAIIKHNNLQYLGLELVNSNNSKPCIPSELQQSIKIIAITDPLSFCGGGSNMPEMIINPELLMSAI